MIALSAELQTVFIAAATSFVTSVITNRAIRKIEDREYPNDHKNENRYKDTADAPELKNLDIQDALHGEAYEKTSFVRIYLEQEPTVDRNEQKQDRESIYSIRFKRMSRAEAEGMLRNDPAEKTNFRFFFLENKSTYGLELLPYQPQVNVPDLRISKTSDAILQGGQSAVYFCESRDFPIMLRARYRGFEIQYNMKENWSLVRATPVKQHRGLLSKKATRFS